VTTAQVMTKNLSSSLHLLSNQ